MNEIIVLILVPSNDTRSDAPRSRTTDQNYRDGWDRIFGAQQKKQDARPN